ncbi:MAG: glycogen synthase [Acidobacteriota bacterium]|jgi:glycosyltransferase involved in cell wall biosynthesis|nr:glycogen synthase [Acidobacteriota bacterium]
MNILLIPSVFPTRRELWPGLYVYEYARSLAHSHDVTVVYPQQLGSPRVGDTPFYDDDRLGPRIRRINYTYKHVAKSWVLSYLAAFRRVLRRVRREWEIDVIYAHVVMPAGLSALMLKRLLGIPVVLTEHWGPVKNWVDEAPSSQKKVLSWGLRHAYADVDYRTAVSDSLAAEIREEFGVSVDGKLDYPIDCDMFRPAAPDEEGRATPSRVLCVTRGHYDPRKGVANLLAAWQAVAQKSNGAAPQLDIVGPDVELLAPHVAELHIGASVNLLPWVPPAELAPLIRRSSLVVIPSSYETFGRSGAEALASGVPVVATRCGGPEEYVHEGTGLLVPKEDPAALAEGILAGLERERFLPAEELARQTRERFGHEVICRRFTEVAENLLASAGRS